MLGTKMKINSLEESLRDVGLNPTRVIDEIERVTGRLIETKANPGAGGPPVPGSAPAQSVDNRQLYESIPGGNRAPGRVDKGKPNTLAEQARRELSADGTDPAANQSEAFRAIKKKRKSAAMKLAARLYRKGKKATLRTASRMYRKRNKRKILVRAKRKLKKFGAKMLAKLHKSGKRIMMQHADTELANLREDLNTGVNSEGSGSTNSYEEAAFNSGMLSMHLGEVFEALGDKESAETMYSLSDIASDLSEDLERVGESDISEAHEGKLRRVLDQTVKALRVWESFGSPTLFQAIDASHRAAEV